MVVVGGGEAGTRACLALREHGWTGAVTLLGDETLYPYERPPLSKTVMLSEREPEAGAILSRERLLEHDIDFRPGSRVVAVDRTSQAVERADGSRVPYHRLLLATGALPRKLLVEGAEHAFYLRTFADALALRARLRPGARLVVIGGGFIGLEIAASAIGRGCAVTLLEAGPRVLMRGVLPEIAAIVAERHSQAGVAFRHGVGVARIRAGAEGSLIELRDGTALPCDGVVVGVGALPETGLAEACRLTIDNGIAADDRLRTSDPLIFAAGDCCSFPMALYDGRRVRLEAWRNAQSQGLLAARNMLGHDLPHDEVPWFWSDQYEQTLQVAGLPDAGVTTVRREGDGTLLFFHLDAAGRLVAASGIGHPALARDVKLAEMLIARRAAPDPAALASPAVRLKSLLVGAMQELSKAKERG